MITVYDHSGNQTATIGKAVTATLRDALGGECTFDFSVLSQTAAGWAVGYAVRLEVGGADYRFNIVRLAKSISNGVPLCAVSCEHKSYELNDEDYNITEFSFTGTPLEGFSQLLGGTNLTAGTVDFTETVTMQINRECSRRAALMQFISILGGEIEYDGSAINIRSHRGSVDVLDVMDEKAVSDLSVTYDSRSGTASYGMSIYKTAAFGTGDNVQIDFDPLGIHVTTRILSMSYNPFNRREISVEVGQYIPSLSENLYQMESNLNEMTERVESIEQITAKYTAEFGDVEGSGTLYFRLAYNDEPTWFIRGGGSPTVTFLMSDGKYIGVQVNGGTGTVSVLCYCTLPEVGAE